ncbi:hypothetical protein FA09DRAFT_151629 [Tilletiopsis washingtonensis]|uniref:Uncharacterized protein n=1 Tax=Tilletiopsis washingtonensis TaxID=58919 RepID=A0A316Z083_9BASI|nr:hypothetical protein FA09DRAFT_151629 [Tilletiopsis washingtonensis]PWN95137.1 hypothetical protein FA09DRAFT_151629 [Tilletiopsis washingtonensis]
MLEVFKDDAAKKSAFEMMNESGVSLIRELCELVEGSVYRGELDAPRWLLSLLYSPTGRSTDGSKTPSFTPETRRFESSLAWSRSTDVARRTALEAEYAAADPADFGTHMLLRRYVLPPAAFEPDRKAAARHARHVAFYDAPFLGGALVKIKSKIREHEESIIAKSLSHPAVRCFQLYQSSGMGKSRLLHELCASATDSVSEPIVGFNISLALPTSSSMPAGDELKLLRSKVSFKSRPCDRRVCLLLFFCAFFEIVAEQFGSLESLQARSRFAELSERTSTAEMLPSEYEAAQSKRRDFLRAVDARFHDLWMLNELFSPEKLYDALRSATRRIMLPPRAYFVLGLDELSALVPGASSAEFTALILDVLRAWSPAAERIWLLFADSLGSAPAATPGFVWSNFTRHGVRSFVPFVDFPLHPSFRTFAGDRPLSQRSLAELSSFEVACSIGRPLWATLPHSSASLDDCLRLAEAKLTNGELMLWPGSTVGWAQMTVLLSQRVVLPQWLRFKEAADKIEEQEIRHHMRVVYDFEQVSEEADYRFTSGFPEEPILASAARRILALRHPESVVWAAACATLRRLCCHMVSITNGVARELASQIITSIAYDRVLEPRRDELCGASDPADKGAWQEDSIITVHEFVSSLLGPEVASQLDDRLGACLMHFSRWFSLDKRCSSPSQQLLKAAFITGIAYKGAAGQADWDLGESGAEHDERAAWPALAGLLPRRICSGLDGAMLLADALSSSHPGVDRPATRHRSPLRPPVHRNLRAGQESRKGQPADLQMVFRC